MSTIPGATNPMLFAAGVLFMGAAAWAFWKGDTRMAMMSIGLAWANCSLGW